MTVPDKLNAARWTIFIGALELLGGLAVLGAAFIWASDFKRVMFVLMGGPMVVLGGAVVIWGCKRLKEAHDRHGDLN